MKALVIGGTGQTGPYIVEGLLERGYEVSMLHGGFHEIEFSRPVEHIHTDAHFTETLEEALHGRKFDLAICTYGRTRLVAEALKGKTERFIVVGGTASYAYGNLQDPRWGPLGVTCAYEDSSPVYDDPQGPRFGYMVWLTEQKVLEAHQAGFYNATIFRYSNVYGPRMVTGAVWSIVRRILDRRKHFIIADGGLRIHSWIYVQNAAHMVLLAVDKPQESAGQIYNVADDTPYITMRHRIELIAKTLSHQWELISMPRELASKLGGSLWGDNRVQDTTKIRTQLGYRDVVPAAQAIPLTARWWAEHPPERGGELESKMGDSFDYAAEDELIRVYKESMAIVSAVGFPEKPPSAHPFRHPSEPGQDWSRPESSRLMEGWR